MWQGYLDEVLENLQNYDQAAADTFRQEVCKYVDGALGFGPVPYIKRGDPFLSAFTEIANALKKHCPEGKLAPTLERNH